MTEGDPGAEDSDRSSDYGSFLRDVAYVADDHMARAAHRDAAEDILAKHARFEIRRRIGAGAFGSVVEAFDREFLTTVALKVLTHTRPESLWLFKQEFRSVADVVHPNLVGLFELLSFQDTWFFTMELIDGPSLFEALRTRESITRHAVIGWFLQLAYGLEALHAAHLLHRDLKPSNVLLDRSDRVVLVDFGLARVLARDTHASDVLPLRAASVAPYSAPEVLAGCAASPASDWFSFGVMLQEALTGRNPRRPALEAVPAPGSSPALTALCLQLMAAAPEARPSACSVVRKLEVLLGNTEPARPASGGSVYEHDHQPLLGRAEESARLQHAHSCSATGPVLLLIDGSAGAGKTTLVESFLAHHAADHPTHIVLRTRCYEREIVPYKALDGLMDELCQVLLAQPEATRCALLPADLGAIARLFPVLNVLHDATHVHSARASGDENPTAIKNRALAALRALLKAVNAISGPVVMFIDDLHWGDVDSARMIAALLEGQAPPLLLITTARNDAPSASPCLVELEARLNANATLGQADHTRVQRVHVGRLAQVAAEQLAARLLNTGDLAASNRAQLIAQEAQGNPLFIEALARHWTALAQNSAGESPAPLTLDSVISARLTTLPAHAQRVLELLTVAREPIEQRVLFAAAGLGNATAATLKLLHWNYWLRERTVDEQRGLALYHQRVEAVIAGRLNPAQARERHRALAAAFDALALGEHERVAEHWFGAGELLLAARRLRIAADRAASALAFERAAALYMRVIEWLQGSSEDTPELRQSLTLARAHALAHAGRCYDAALLYEQLWQVAPPTAAADLGLRAAEQYLIGGYFERGVGRISTALSEVGLHYPRSTALALLETVRLLAPVQWFGVPSREARNSSAKPVDSLRLRQVDISRAAAKGMFDVDPLRAALFELRALRVALRAGEPARIARALAGVGSMLVMQGRIEASLRGAELLSRANTMATRLADPVLLAIVEFSASCGKLTDGAWASALSGFDHALEELEQHGRGVTWERNAARVGAIIALEALGRWPEAAQRTAAWHREATELGNVFASTTAALFAARHDLAADAVSHAHERVRAALAAWSPRVRRAFHVQHVYAARFTAQAHLYDEQPRLALEEVQRIWGGASRAGQLQVQLARFDLWELRGRAAIGSAPYEASARARALRQEALRAAHVLGKELRVDAAPTASLLRAAVAHQTGDTARTLCELNAAGSGFANADMSIHEACVQYCKGEVLGGTRGEGLVASARKTLHIRGIARPERWVSLVAPGFR